MRFRAEGLKVGLYYSLIDWHHPEFTVDRNHPQRDDLDFREREQHRDMKQNTEYMRNQVTELLTGYGHIDVMWFDFSYPGEDGKGSADWESEKLIQLVRKLQPHVVVNNRLDLEGSGDVDTPEQYQPSKGVKDADGNPIIWEACQTFSGVWGYHRDEQTWKTTHQLLLMLIDGVSKGGNLLLNVGPTGRGEFDYRAQDRLSAMGDWMRTNSRSIYGCGCAPEAFQAPTDCRYTYNPESNRLYLHLLVWPFKAVHLAGLAGKVKYAQILHDASELTYRDASSERFTNMYQVSDTGELTINLPVLQPNIEIPTIELFLK